MEPCDKTFILLIFGTLNLILLIVSLKINYQDIILMEHIRFRHNFPSQILWKNEPEGTLKIYLFSVTNSEAFQAGLDNKLKIKEIGPIVYKIKTRETDFVYGKSTLTYRKIRYDKVVFDEKRSLPGILNETLTIPNYILLTTAVKFNSWFSFLKRTFNVISQQDTMFLNRTPYEILWNFTSPILKNGQLFLSNIPTNVGFLNNSLKNKDEVYNVNIGPVNGMENFFRVNSLNGDELFREHFEKRNFDKGKCPVFVRNTFDNTMFPPKLQHTSNISIMAPDSCRIFKLKFSEDVLYKGFESFKFVIDNNAKSTCLNSAEGILLPDGFFDISKCILKTPLASSYPHFYNSSYNYSEHWDGLQPNAKDHRSHIIVEPFIGIPLEEVLRFQFNIPIPELFGYKSDLYKFNKMMIPVLWYEYEMKDLNGSILTLMNFIIHVVPTLQITLIVFFLFGSIYCFSKLLISNSARINAKRLRRGKLNLKNSLSVENPPNEMETFLDERH